MSLLRLLNWQGMAGVAVGLTLLVMLTVQKLEAVHWKKQSEAYERLYQQEQAAFATTTANYRAAAAEAAAADTANGMRVADAQRAINERTSDDYQDRIAAARALAQRLRDESAGAASNPRGGPVAPVPGLSVAASGAAEIPSQGGLPVADRQLATEQAIQLDELINWVRQQHEVDSNRPQAVSKRQ